MSATLPLTERGRQVQAAGHSVWVTDVGDGPPVVLLHGGGPGASGLSNYVRNVEPLSTAFRVIVIDLPGYGRSDKPSFTGSRLGIYAQVVRDVLDALDVERAHLVGNSLGGGTTLRFALDFPDRASRLVLMGSMGGAGSVTPQPTEGIQRLIGYYDAPGPSRARLQAFLQSLVFDPSAITEAMLEERFAASAHPDVLANPPVRRTATPPVEDLSLWKDVARVTHPTLIVWGRDDRVMPLDNGLFLLAQLPDARLHVFSRCGHWAQWEHAAAFNALVEQFLSADLSPEEPA